MRQPKWDKYETALLIEAYGAIKENRTLKKTIVAELSSSLRKIANFKIDDTFRNENGINMRLNELEYLFSEENIGLKNTSVLFREMVDLYRKNRQEYEKILSEAKKMAIDLHGESPETLTDILTSSIDKLIRKSKNGIAEDDICKHFPNYSKHQINKAIDSCHAVLILKKYYHRDNIVYYKEMADILLDVITRQFFQNGNYTSAKQLYNEARPRLDDFFFYNNAFDSRQEIYDLAAHLFFKEKYKGNSFIFMNNMHIWKEEPDYPKDYQGLLIKFARDHGNTFSREDAASYFEQIGSTNPSATFSNVIVTAGSKSFLQYDKNQFVLTEALHINEYFLTSVKAQIENLLEDEDYVSSGEINDFFYTTLPKLPDGICWSVLLLKDVLRVYETDFTTIEAGKDNDKKAFPAAIVRKHSRYKRFSDIVWNEISKSFPLPKEFTAMEFREFLLDKGFIRGSEKMSNVHKTVDGDIRFYWTENNGRVTIN